MIRRLRIANSHLPSSCVTLLFLLARNAFLLLHRPRRTLVPREDNILAGKAHVDSRSKEGRKEAREVSQPAAELGLGLSGRRLPLQLLRGASPYYGKISRQFSRPSSRMRGVHRRTVLRSTYNDVRACKKGESFANAPSRMIVKF